MEVRMTATERYDVAEDFSIKTTTEATKASKGAENGRRFNTQHKHPNGIGNDIQKGNKYGGCVFRHAG